MSFLDAIILGLVQGLAEFLPISSSGHLVIAEYFLGIHQTNILFEVSLHLATLLAIFIYFKKDIVSIKLPEVKAIIIGSIPVIVIGFLFKDQLEALFSSVIVVSLLLIITGVLNLVTDNKLNSAKNKEMVVEETKKEIGFKQAFVIGLFQAFAILPGISRSGSTVAGGILQNVDRQKAFRFSFLMVIPVILGASLLQLIEVVNNGMGNLSLSILLVGGLAAFISGLFSLKVFAYIIKKSRLEIFGFYCIGVGLFSFIVTYKEAFLY